MAWLLLSVFTLSCQAQEADDTRGDLVYFISDYVAPSDMEVYESWAKEFKILADETNAPDYFVNFNGSAMNYGMVLGKDMSAMDEMNKAWEKWSEANPQSEELNNKNIHTVQYSTTSLWRTNPTESYMPEGYDDNIERPYVRLDKNYIIPGQVKRAKEIISEYKAEWEKQQISYRVLSVWNVFGEERACVQFVSWYKDRADWLASQKEISEKVSSEKLAELHGKWNSVLRKRESIELTARPDLSHSNE
jgi:hypothetical protein